MFQVCLGKGKEHPGSWLVDGHVFLSVLMHLLMLKCPA